MVNNCLVYVSDRPVPYLQAWEWQQNLVKQRQQAQNLDDILLILEHPQVYTLGQGSSWEFVKFNPERSDIEWHRVERGGEVTFHAIGQIVVYPILNLRHYQQDLHWYLRQLEEVIILTLASYGLKGERIVGLTGVWVEGKKIAQVGIKVSKWITMHGFAVNVDMDMTGFDLIVPCGIGDRQVCQLKEFMRSDNLLDNFKNNPESVKQVIAQAFSEVFNVRLERIDGSELG